MRDTTRKKGHSAKLQFRWKGPYLVVGLVTDFVYEIQQSPRSSKQTVHQDRLKLFHGDFPNWLEHAKVDLGDDTDAPEYPTSKSDPEITNLIPNSPAEAIISSSSSSECEEESVYTRSGHLSRRPA